AGALPPLRRRGRPSRHAERAGAGGGGVGAAIGVAAAVAVADPEAALAALEGGARTQGARQRQGLAGGGAKEVVHGGLGGVVFWCVGKVIHPSARHMGRKSYRSSVGGGACAQVAVATWVTARVGTPGRKPGRKAPVAPTA